MTAPETIWVDLDIGMSGSTGRWVTQGTENPFGRIEYRRADLPPTDAQVIAHPSVAALVRAADSLDGVSGLLRAWTPFEVMKQPDAASKAFCTLADRIDVLTAALAAMPGVRE